MAFALGKGPGAGHCQLRRDDDDKSQERTDTGAGRHDAILHMFLLPIMGLLFCC
jgi:hypothetical protein